MPEDPLSAISANINASIGERANLANNIFASFNKGMGTLNEQVIKGMTAGVMSFNEIAPHTVLAKVVATGQGTFSAKMTTSEINKMNIY
jgi:hypothetical protein